MTPEEKKKKQPVSRGALTPAKVKAPIYDRSPGLFRRDPGVQENMPEASPVYFSKENAPEMGWQARMARNRDLDANYRSALGHSSAEKIANEGTRRAITEKGMGTASLEKIAAGRQATDITRTGMINKNRLGVRSSIEAGLGARQAMGQTFARGERVAGQDFASEEGEKTFGRNMILNRETLAADLVKNKILTDSDQVSDFNEEGLGGVDDFSVPKTTDYKHISSVTGEFTDLKRGVTESRELTPSRVFDAASGTYKEPAGAAGGDRESLINKYYDSETGSLKIPMDEVPEEDISLLIEEIRKSRKNR